MKIVTFLGKSYSLDPAPPGAPDPKPIAINLLSASELLTIYNLVASNLGKTPTNRFADSSSARRRTWALLEEFDTVVAQEREDLERMQGDGKDETGSGPTYTAPEPEAPKPPPTPKVERKKRGMRFVFPAEDKVKPVRPESARGKALAVLQREGGGTFKDVQDATGWNEKQAYEGIRLLHYYTGYGMRERKEGDETYITVFTRP